MGGKAIMTERLLTNEQQEAHRAFLRREMGPVHSAIIVETILRMIEQVQRPATGQAAELKPEELITFDAARKAVAHAKGEYDDSKAIAVLEKFVEQQAEHHRCVRKLLDALDDYWNEGPDASRQGWVDAAAKVSDFHPDK